MSEVFSISEAAAAVGRSVWTLRRWERNGLISPVSRVGGKRRYGREDIDTLKKIAAGPEIPGTEPEISPVALVPKAWKDLEPEQAVRQWSDIRSEIDRLAPPQRSLPACPYCKGNLTIITIRNEPVWVCGLHGQVPPQGSESLRFDSFVRPPLRPSRNPPRHRDDGLQAAQRVNPYEISE
jgi:hypothetical protein